MTIKKTQWSPDTCTCIFEYIWDDSLPESSRAHNLATVIKCPEHSVQADNNAVWNTVLEENPRKNQAWKEILDNATADMVETDPSSGTLVFKPGIFVDYAYSGTVPNRVLTLTLRGKTLTANQRNGIQNKLDTRFGPGKVVFVQG